MVNAWPEGCSQLRELQFTDILTCLYVHFFCLFDISPVLYIVPVTNQWRDELMRKAQKALSKALSQDQPSGSRPSSRPLSRQGSRSLPRQFDHLDDKAVSSVLYTESGHPEKRIG